MYKLLFLAKNIFVLILVGVSFSLIVTNTALAQDQPAAKSQLVGDLSIEIGLSGMFSAGLSTADNDELSGLQAGGHDANRNGFTLQNLELSIGSTVDNYFDARTHLIYLIDAEGETVVELEEAFITTRGLPGGLQVKAGQFFTEFGRQNIQHPHTWSFVDQPVILSRLFGGDGLRSQGVRMAWLMPTSWYSEVYLGAQNANGETVTSFLYAPDEEVAGHVLQSRNARNVDDLLYSTRWLNGFDLSSTTSMNIGFSGLRGPNASGDETDTLIYGADVYFKWQASQSQRGFPFVAWHTEFLQRDYDALDVTNADHEALQDAGGFSQILWGIQRGWVVGMRYDFAWAEGNTESDSLRDTRTRISPNITWYPSEYSRLRLQYNYEDAQHLDDNANHSIWLQYEFNIGSHAAHTF